MLFRGLVALLLSGMVVWCVVRMPTGSLKRVWIADGKSESLLTDAAIIPDLSGAYVAALMRICDWNVVDEWTPSGKEAARQRYLSGGSVITPIGTWGRYRVFDLTNLEILHKGVALQDASGMYRILYLQFVWERQNFISMPYIETVQGQQVLSFRTTVPGTANSDMGFHFVQDLDTGEPRMTDQSAIEKAIVATVPTGCAVWKGGGLDFTNQRYSMPVWRRDDANCCPSGGKIEMDLRLIGAALTVVSVRYQPEYDWDFNRR